jgi:hypothetical protein
VIFQSVWREKENASGSRSESGTRSASGLGSVSRSLNVNNSMRGSTNGGRSRSRSGKGLLFSGIWIESVSESRSNSGKAALTCSGCWTEESLAEDAVRRLENAT